MFTKGDTLFFTLENKTYDKIDYYKDSDYYTLYMIVDGKEILMEDTTFRGLKKPITLSKNEKITIKKIITNGKKNDVHTIKIQS